jgi:hypothetical protein
MPSSDLFALKIAVENAGSGCSPSADVPLQCCPDWVYRLPEFLWRRLFPLCKPAPCPEKLPEWLLNMFVVVRSTSGRGAAVEFRPACPGTVFVGYLVGRGPYSTTSVDTFAHAATGDLKSCNALPNPQLKGFACADDVIVIAVGPDIGIESVYINASNAEIEVASCDGVIMYIAPSGK